MKNYLGVNEVSEAWDRLLHMAYGSVADTVILQAQDILYLGSEADALDAVSEAICRALQGLKHLRQPELFETWITRILINTCSSELRRRSFFHFGGEDALPDSAGPDAYEHLPLKEAIRRLPEELRSVVILRFFSGYTQAETAAALNIPQGTAATRQKRALALLKLELGEEGQA